MIQISHLTKIYPGGKGIFDVSFHVEEGEAFGFLGPNGSGKTTTIRQLMGFTNATEGYCTIKKLDTRTHAKEIQAYLGYVPGEISFFDNMTGTEFMDFISRMRGKSNPKRRQMLVERFELESDRKIRKMSKGMKQKVGLITAFMHDPEILILDEPTSGLDPLMQRRFIELILEERSRGKTILMSSHQFYEVERSCQRAAIIKDGRIATVADITELKSNLRKSYIVSVSGESDLEQIRLSGLPHQVLSNGHIELTITGDYNLMLTTLAKCNVQNLETATQTLEQIFIDYYGKEGF